MIASCDHELLHQRTDQTSEQSQTKFVAAECGDQHAKSVRFLSMSATTSATANVNDPANTRHKVANVYVAAEKSSRPGSPVRVSDLLDVLDDPVSLGPVP